MSSATPPRFGLLDHVGLVHVLGELFDQVVLPTMVADELAHPRRRFRAFDASAYSFMRVTAPARPARINEFLERLDPGEAEAIVLAIELNADAVLIDETKGRAVVESMGLTATGTLGILRRAKEAGLLVSVGPVLARLVDELGFFVSPSLRQRFLLELGE